MNTNRILVSLTMLFIGCSEEIADGSIHLLNTDGKFDLINMLYEQMRLLHGRIRMLKRSYGRINPIDKSHGHGKILKLQNSYGIILLVGGFGFSDK